MAKKELQRKCNLPFVDGWLEAFIAVSRRDKKMDVLVKPESEWKRQRTAQNIQNRTDRTRILWISWYFLAS